MNKEIEKLRELAKSTDPKDLTKVLKDPNCTESVIDIICSNEGIDWDSNEGHELEKLLVSHPNLPNEQFEITYEYSDSEEVRNLVLENPNCPIELKIKIVKDPNCLSDVIDKIVMDENFPWGTQDAETIKDAIAANPNTSSAQLQNLYDNAANEHQKKLILDNPSCPKGLQPNIMRVNKMTKEIDRKDKGYPAIVTKIIKKGEDVDKKVEQRKIDYMVRWQCPTKEYSGRLGIRAKIPSFFKKIDDCCKKWTEKEINKIQNFIQEKKVIPILNFVPDEFQNFTKQVWWLIPFVIWKEDTASWIFVDKNGIHGAHPEDDDGPVIWGWDAVDYFDIEWPEENLCVLTVYNDSDVYLTFSEFVSKGCGSYLSIIPNIYQIYKPVIEASGEFSWKHGAGGEGYKGFKTQKELLDESVWDQALRPDPAFYS